MGVGSNLRQMPATYISNIRAILEGKEIAQ
jgi:hypothetical protein